MFVVYIYSNEYRCTLSVYSPFCVVCHCMNVTQFSYPFYCRWMFGCFQFWTIVNGVAVLYMSFGERIYANVCVSVRCVCLNKWNFWVMSYACIQF